MSEPKRNLKPGSTKWFKNLSMDSRARIAEKRIIKEKRRAMNKIIASARKSGVGTFGAALR